MPKGGGVRKRAKRRSFTTVSHDLNRTVSLAHLGPIAPCQFRAALGIAVFCELFVACETSCAVPDRTAASEW